MGSVLFKKINVVDVRQQRILPGMDVLVEGKKIAVIAEHIAETADRVIDGEGLYLTPGIIDLHVHSTWDGSAISEDLDEKVDIYLRLDNCASRSEFVENALRFYIGYLNTKNAGGFLPEALSAMLTGTLDNFAGRMGSLLFKQGVDLNVLGQIIAYDTDIDEGEYQRLRGRAIRDMKRTNGRISFKDALDFQKSV